MLRKTALGLICAGSLVSANVLAMSHELKAGLSVEYEFPPHSPQVLMNFTIFTINAVCTIQTPTPDTDSDSDSDSNPDFGNYILHVKGLYSSGIINGQDFSKNDEMDFPVKNGDIITLTAYAAARVEFTNIGENTIKALCKTV